jgi:chromosome segregation ATPase
MYRKNEQLFPRAAAACAVLFALVPALLQGCTRDTGELEKQILARDASFKSVIEMRDSIRDETASEKAAYLSESSSIDREIASLKERKIRLRKDHAQRMERIKRKLSPVRTDFQADLAEMKSKLSFKTTQIRAIDKSINEINTLIEKEDTLAMTQEEMRTWNERLASLISQKEELAAERERLASEIELTEMKIKVISAQ